MLPFIISDTLSHIQGAFSKSDTVAGVCYFDNVNGDYQEIYHDLPLKFSLCTQSLHTTVLPLGAEKLFPLEVQIRTAQMHRLAEYGIAGEHSSHNVALFCIVSAALCACKIFTPCNSVHGT